MTLPVKPSQQAELGFTLGNAHFHLSRYRFLCAKKLVHLLIASIKSSARRSGVSTEPSSGSAAEHSYCS
jgi:hypothetical protein